MNQNGTYLIACCDRFAIDAARASNVELATFTVALVP